MHRVWIKINKLIEAFCNFAFSMAIFFMFVLLLSPLFKWLEGRSGILWVLLTILIMGAFYLLVSLGAGPVFESLDKIRRGEAFSDLLKPIRNISSVMGIYSALKLEYFLIHNIKVSTDASWSHLIWEFLSKF
ncbi:hypothetical protein GWO43_12720 [candidate division KSB1 bacterium]|nr:hypothetical protein [candidate division KSB1 bacterium]NIR71286.1 hypothetical protein [candidate division KSB1 bacterium]NIS24815.1 hypothetical protein [candidate division KSB1 bacterium]NIT71722.1 hypothetical protein [candidate division KSB1 bacterium]NIU25451.1 hypothetical protein [candidate division KSB1 bacterium]